MAENKTNSLLDAISIVAEGVVKKYQYDQTIEAKILSTARKDEGIYKCEYENAIFDAYASGTQSFYENETVYVNIPKGDFSKQKHIIGRKVDLQAAPNKTFNFKMPFDDFVGLESLTIENPYIRDKNKGFLANYPEHGGHQEVDSNYLTILAPYQTALRQIDDTYNATVKTIEDNKKLLLSYLDNSYLNTIHASCNVPESRLSLYNTTVGSESVSYFYVIQQAYETGDVSSAAVLFSDFVNVFNTTHHSNTNTYVSIGQEDKTKLQEAAAKYEKLYKEAAERTWNSQRQEKVLEMQNATKSFTENNYSHLWSWKNTDSKPKPLIETKLGISLNIKTDLGPYMPQQGEYGLRVVITGITKPTEEEASTTKTVELLWTNDQMYGNTYAFYTPYNQQRIFDISNFLTLDQIDVFFYQNTDNIIDNGYYMKNGQQTTQTIAYNFIDDKGELIPYTYQDQNGLNYLLPFNIYYDNLEVLLGLTTDECSTDRTLLYTYDDVLYGQDPFDPNARSNKDKRELKFAWIHKTESGDIVLVDHVQKKNDSDIKALEAYDAQIYWYHYEYGCLQDSTLLTHKYGGLNWHFLEDEKLVNQTRTIKHVDDETGEITTTTETYDTYGKFDIEVLPDIEKAREKWKVIVVCKGIPYSSQPLVFTNIDTGVETDAIDRVNEIAFRLLRETLDEKGNKILKEDNSLTSFYVYDENGQAIQDDNNLSWDEIWFYIQVWIRNNDDGTYMPLALAVDDNWDGDSFEIEWHYPEGNSMLTQISPCTNADLENAELAATVESNVEGFNEAIRKCTRKFKIQRFWDMRALSNTIAAVVKRNGRIYKPQQEFLFGQSGSMGTPYTVGILLDHPENGNLINGEYFEIRAVVYDSTGHPAPNKNYIFSWELMSDTKITAGALDYGDTIVSQRWDTLFEAMTYHDDGTGNVNNVLKGYIRNDHPPIFRVTVTGAADYPISQTTGFSLVDKSTTNSHYRINCPSKVEFRSDGKIPITINSKFEVKYIDEGGIEIPVYPEWRLQQYKLNASKNYELIGDSTNTNGTYAASKIKYIALKKTSAPDVPLYPNIPDEDATLYYIPDSSTVVRWYSGYKTEASGAWNTASTYKTLKQALGAWWNDQSEWYRKTYPDRYDTYLELLNSAVAPKIPSHNEYALDPYVGGTTNYTTQFQWKDELGELYYNIIAYEKDNTYFKRAIPFTRNVYSSSLINSWDGTTLELDNDNCAVLAKMLSAGAKENGRFTGVIMGDWSAKGDTSIDTPGLYGFKYGEQVFGLLTDGTGFIGKSGKGRIEFDGNRSLISNSDRTCYINLDPVTFTLDENGTITELNNYYAYSQYFLYAKTPKSSRGTTEGEDKLEEKTYWSKQFLEDTENDYFIVDPNNGVLTSGGIIARYGKIGNWMISDSGLYQRITDLKVPLNNRYMYLGYDGTNTDAKNRYMIYAGYYPPTTTIVDAITEPMFTVDWRGYITARAGKIGLNSPWYITDNGLTQTVTYTDLSNKKIYSTIFLGNEYAPSDKNQWSDNPDDVKDLTLLPNDTEGDNAGPEVLGYSDRFTSEYNQDLRKYIYTNYPTKGHFAIYAGGNGYERIWNSSTKQFERKWVNDKTIKFGVRADGTLYSKFGTIGSWNFSDAFFTSADDTIVLDGKGLMTLPGITEGIPKIVLGFGRTILFGNGRIKLINGNENGEVARGCIDLAAYQLSASTEENSGADVALLKSVSSSSSSASGGKESFTVDWKYKAVGKKTYTWNKSATITGSVSSTNATIAKPNYFSIWETALVDAASNEHPGIDIITGKVNSTTLGTIILPSGTTTGYATLGSEAKPWNIFAGSIWGGATRLYSLYIDQDALYIGGAKAATQIWVQEQLKKLYDLIDSTTSGSNDTTTQSYIGGNALGTALANALDQLTLYGGSENELTANVDYVMGQAVALIIKMPYVKFNITAGTDGGTDSTGKNTLYTEGMKWLQLYAGNIPSNPAKSIVLPGNYMVGGMAISQYLENLANSVSYGVVSYGDCTVDNDGKVNLKFYCSNLQNKELFTITFNQADTAFFKTRGYHSLRIGSSESNYRTWAERESASDSYKYDSGSSGGSVRIAPAYYYQYNNGSPYIRCWFGITNWNTDGYDAEGYFAVDAYDAYLDGWNDACSYVYRSGNDIYGPKYGSPGKSKKEYEYSPSSHSWSYSRVEDSDGNFLYYKVTSHSYSSSSLSSV